MNINDRQYLTERFDHYHALACEKYPAFANMPKPRLEFYTKGSAGGWAVYKEWKIRLNLYVLSQSRSLAENIISHEFAHLVAFVVFRTTGHGKYFKMVHRTLGGTGDRCYNATKEGVKIIPGRVTNQYLYENDSGSLWVGPKHHAAMQRGKYQWLQNNRGVKVFKDDYTGQSRKKGA